VAPEFFGRGGYLTMFVDTLGYRTGLPTPLARNAIAADTPKPQTERARGATVSLRGVARRFGERRVLDGFDLHIPAGGFVSIVGRSGEGKSTLLRLLAGLDVPDSGAIELDGRTVAGIPPEVTIMFQDARLLPWQTVEQNVGIARGPNWRAQALEALSAVGLADRARDWPAALSGGQKQRVALARALVRHPGLLLLDEPLGALDALTRGDMQRLIERIWRQAGFTAVLVTHDVAEAVALSDRILVLRGGRIALDMSVDLPRPRPRASAEGAALEAQILDALLGSTARPDQEG
jgi:sulfonate transport system ATP-binding protein